jgi:glycosyltransferase involved in cell wall biosynthesis
MKENGIENIIVCFLKGKLYDEALELGLDIRLVEQRSRFDLKSIDVIKDICEKENIDIINCHGGRANFAALFLKRRYRAKYATTIHSDYRDDYRGNLYKTLIFSNINRLVLNSFDCYITVSESFKDMLIKRGFDAGKIFVVYNGIDFNREIEHHCKDEVAERYGISQTDHYVSMVARLHPVKGHRVFLEACKNVLGSFKDVVFILVGDGDIRDELMEYGKQLGISDNLNFAGFNSRMKR